ncbi:S8 family serine peptidase [Vreelandella rituensis]|uniref:Peptidase S8/S53 subtilisin kexin sedolisin n=1 Tax=Vreelandella rituensis TaxID=2282306 RepID=A0A368TSB4_9GAMM|nr:S8 family serine peptidase [Halomonas rituensis]RCV87236.1 peptidase S8/S53 subtilisin kexin sedolisin [Halomonas rituensis]
MPVDPVRIGIVDSGCNNYQTVADSAAFVLRDDALWREESVPDRLGHGASIVGVISTLAPQAKLFSAQVFQQRLATTATQVAAAIDWLLECDVQIINLSLGLRQDRGVLREACERALKQGVLLCASSPARGDPVFPAAYPGVFRMTGDARCAREEIAYLETAFADFGGCVRPLYERLQLSGASLGCAHMSAHLARYLQQHADRPRLSKARQWLIGQSRYHGPERRVK